MKTTLRTRWSHPINLGMLTLYFILALTLHANSLLNPYLIALSVLFIISLVFFFGTRLIITDEYVEYRHWMFRKKKVLIKDIEEAMIQKGRISKYLEISTPDMSINILPFFSVTLISILSLIMGRPYSYEEAQNLVKQELKGKKIIDFALVGVLVLVFLSMFSFRLSVMNQPEIISVRITPNPEFPLATELENDYSLYVSDVRIWSKEDAATAALYAIKPELRFRSKLLYNTYLVCFNDNDANQFYVIYYLGLPGDLSYVFFVYQGGYDIYFMAYQG